MLAGAAVTTILPVDAGRVRDFYRDSLGLD
jgi:hypothetical protein